MKVKINGSVSEGALKTILDKQSKKVDVIDEFCKEHKINDFSYSDAELEYEVIKKTNIKQSNKSKHQVEVRSNEK